MITLFYEFFIPQPAIFGPIFLILAAALILDVACGDFPWLFSRIPHPVVWIGTIISWFERRLNRPNRHPNDLIVRGFLTSLVVIVLAALFGGGIQLISAKGGWYRAAEIFLLAVLIAQKGLYQHVRAVSDSMRKNGLSGGRRAVSMIVGRNPDSLDEAGVCRAAIESCAENFSDGVVAPLFWFVIGGPIGLCVYKAINTLDSMIGHRDERYLYFGRFAARLDDVANFVPARLAGGIIIVAASIMPSAKGKNAFRVMMADARKHKSPNAGWQEAAFAGALGLSLAGPRQYGNEVVNDPYIGSGRRKAGTADIDRALVLFILACMMNALWPLVLKGIWLVI